MNGGSHTSAAAAAAAALDGLDTGWFGGGSIEAAPGSVEQPTGLPERAAHGWLSWLFWSNGQQRGSRRPPSAGRSAKAQQRHRANGADGAAPRLLRAESTPKLHTASSGGLPARAWQQQEQQPPSGAGAGFPTRHAEQAEGGAPPGTDDAAAAAPKRAGPSTAAARSSLGQKTGSRTSLAKQANYAERRQAWRQR